MSGRWRPLPCESLVVDVPLESRRQLRRYNIKVVPDVWPSKTTRFARKAADFGWFSSYYFHAVFTCLYRYSSIFFKWYLLICYPLVFGLSRDVSFSISWLFFWPPEAAIRAAEDLVTETREGFWKQRAKRFHVDAHFPALVTRQLLPVWDSISPDDEDEDARQPPPDYFGFSQTLLKSTASCDAKFQKKDQMDEEKHRIMAWRFCHGLVVMLLCHVMSISPHLQAGKLKEFHTKNDLWYDMIYDMVLYFIWSYCHLRSHFLISICSLPHRGLPWMAIGTAGVSDLLCRGPVLHRGSDAGKPRQSDQQLVVKEWWDFWIKGWVMEFKHPT